MSCAGTGAQGTEEDLDSTLEMIHVSYGMQTSTVVSREYAPRPAWQCDKLSLLFMLQVTEIWAGPGYKGSKNIWSAQGRGF